MKRSDTVLHWWASFTVVIMGLVAVTPRDLMPATDRLPLLVVVLGGIAGAIAAGFYFRMLFECAFKSDVRYRALWLMFCVVLPVFSTIVYYMTTRSVLYQYQPRSG